MSMNLTKHYKTKLSELPKNGGIVWFVKAHSSHIHPDVFRNWKSQLPVLCHFKCQILCRTHYEDIAGSNEADGSDIMNTEEIPKDQLAITE